MLVLAYPWLLVLLPLPFLLRRLLPPFRQSRAGVTVPFLDRLAGILGREPTAGAVVTRAAASQAIVLWLVWLCTVAALARPQWLEQPVTRAVPTRDLLLAVDLSGSMETKDFTDAGGQQVDRLTAVKEVLDDFLTRRQGDRVGLIFFGSAAFVQAPFTQDVDALRTLLAEAQVRMAGPQTAFGDAIGLALTVFEHDPAVRERVLIVLTDGNDTGSQVPPREAAAIAHDRHVTIHTVAVGDPTAAGEGALDEETLRAVAAATGGTYAHAGDRAALAEVYRRLDALGTHEVETVSHRPRTDLFWWPLASGLLLSLGLHGVLAARAAWASRDVAAPPSAVLPALAVFGDLHFLRPWWLLALIPAVGLFAFMRRQQDPLRAWRGVIADHLLPHLVGGVERRGGLGPAPLLLGTWTLGTLAVAGPTWRREASPFGDDEAVLVVVLEVTPGMLARDVQPSRLERAVQKMHDLLALRPGTRAGLVAYAGSAHLAMPLTRDHELVARFAGELVPDVMPREGDAVMPALALADEQIRRSGLPGSILLVTDGIPPDQIAALTARARAGGAPVQILAVAAGADAPVPSEGPPAVPLDSPTLQKAAAAMSAGVTTLTPDDTDVRSLARHARTSVTAGESRTGERWQDAGYWLAWPVAALVLLWFRPGWVARST